jgi:hypothetical protein
MQQDKRNPGMATAAAFLMLSMAGLATTGCTVDSHKQGDGDNVKIATPFGGMSIKTDQNAVTAETGLPAYPGAQIEKKGDDGHNSGAADINMSFGSFKLRVKAVSYTTPDSPDKVLAFYRKGLAQYGTVIQCNGHQPVGTPTHTPDGLDCSDDSHKANVKVDEDYSERTELKAGSKQHQHIVGINPQGSGTKFGLVALDLPGHLSFGDDDKDSDKGEHKE